MQIKYTNGGSLMHWVNRDQASGNPYRADTGNKGRFGFSPYRYEGDSSIKSNYKYGHSPEDYSFKRNNRYTVTRTVDGEEPTVLYTQAGEKRKEYEESVNGSRSRKNKYDDETLYDTDRWVRDDYKNFSDAAKTLSDAARGTSNMIDMFNVPKNNKRIDLSQMTDDELRNILDRERMERQYNNYFNEAQTNKGADYAKKFFDFLAWSGQQAMTAAQIVSIVRSFR